MAAHTFSCGSGPNRFLQSTELEHRVHRTGSLVEAEWRYTDSHWTSLIYCVDSLIWLTSSAKGVPDMKAPLIQYLHGSSATRVATPTAAILRGLSSKGHNLHQPWLISQTLKNMTDIYWCPTCWKHRWRYSMLFLHLEFLSACQFWKGLSWSINPKRVQSRLQGDQDVLSDSLVW